MNPGVEVEALPMVITRDTAEQIVKGVDIVVDALDHFAPRYAINEACVRNGVPYIYGGALATYGNVSTIIPGESACLECIIGRMDDGAMPTCETAGVFPPVLSVVSSIQVREAIYLLLGKKPLLTNKLLYADLNSLEFQEFNVLRRPDCEVCGETVGEAQPKSSDVKVVELCGKNSYMVSPPTPLSLDLDRSAQKIGEAFKMKIKAAFGLTFDYSERVTASLMKTGNMLIKGAEDNREAIAIYDKVMKTIES